MKIIYEAAMNNTKKRNNDIVCLGMVSGRTNFRHKSLLTRDLWWIGGESETFIDIEGTKAFVGWQISSIIPACYPLNVIIHGKSSSQQWKSYKRTPIQARAALNRTKTTKNGFIEWKFFLSEKGERKPGKIVDESARKTLRERGNCLWKFWHFPAKGEKK